MTPDEAERIAAAIAAITESLQNFRADVMVELADLEDMVTRAEQEACEQESPATEAPARAGCVPSLQDAKVGRGVREAAGNAHALQALLQDQRLRLCPRGTLDRRPTGQGVPDVAPVTVTGPA